MNINIFVIPLNAKNRVGEFQFVGCWGTYYNEILLQIIWKEKKFNTKPYELTQ